MTDHEIRQTAAQDFLGASIAMRLFIDALQSRFEPGAFSDADAAEMHAAFAAACEAGEKLARFGLRLKMRPGENR